jgi:hypothetical protein
LNGTEVKVNPLENNLNGILVISDLRVEYPIKNNIRPKPMNITKPKGSPPSEMPNNKPTKNRKPPTKKRNGPRKILDLFLYLCFFDHSS